MLDYDTVVTLIKDTKGNISAIADAFGVGRNSIYSFCKSTHPELWDMIQEQRAELVDIAESMLLKNVKAGREASVFFTLKTLGKDRGYVERQENVVSTEGGPIFVIDHFADEEGE